MFQSINKIIGQLQKPVIHGWTALYFTSLHCILFPWFDKHKLPDLENTHNGNLTWIINVITVMRNKQFLKYGNSTPHLRSSCQIPISALGVALETSNVSIYRKRKLCEYFLFRFLFCGRSFITCDIWIHFLRLYVGVLRCFFFFFSFVCVDKLCYFDLGLDNISF